MLFTSCIPFRDQPLLVPSREVGNDYKARLQPALCSNRNDPTGTRSVATRRKAWFSAFVEEREASDVATCLESEEENSSQVFRQSTSEKSKKMMRVGQEGGTTVCDKCGWPVDEPTTCGMVVCEECESGHWETRVAHAPTNFKGFVPGGVYGVARWWGAYRHVFVYVRDGVVVHFDAGPLEAKAEAACGVERLERVLGRAGQRVTELVAVGEAPAARRTVTRALSLVGLRGYHLLVRNCEQVARWAAFGVAGCSQYLEVEGKVPSEEWFAGQLSSKETRERIAASLAALGCSQGWCERLFAVYLEREAIERSFDVQEA